MAAKRRSGRLDLSLLPSLDALLAERSVTRAAARLGVTQSAVSHALAKLRAHYGDPLLVRTPQGLVLTERAERLADVVRRTLDALDRADRGEQTFDPSAARRSFTVAMSDYVGLAVLPGLLAHLDRHAPGIDLVVRPVVPEIDHSLEAGTVDLVLAHLRDDSPGLYRQKLVEHRWLSVVRAGHAVLGRPMTLKAWAALKHVTVSLRGGRGQVDEALARLDVRRRVAVKVPQFALAAFLVARSDLVLTLPEGAARLFASLMPLDVFEPPLALPSIVFWQIWHERNHHDPAHEWLRKVVSDLVSQRER
jgi:DNA-binding transcriptional LysR family regulator